MIKKNKNKQDWIFLISNTLLYMSQESEILASYKSDHSPVLLSVSFLASLSWVHWTGYQAEHKHVYCVGQTFIIRQITKVIRS